MVQQKWHTAKRELKIGDIVLVKDAKSVRGHWKLGKVSKVYQSQDQHVRRCSIMYKPKLPGLQFPKSSILIDRPIQDVVVIVPVDAEVN